MKYCYRAACCTSVTYSRGGKERGKPCEEILMLPSQADTNSHSAVLSFFFRLFSNVVVLLWMESREIVGARDFGEFLFFVKAEIL